MSSRSGLARQSRIAASLAVAAFFAGNVMRAEAIPANLFSEAELEPLSWSELQGWAEEDHQAALRTFLTSCKALVRGKRSQHAGSLVDAALRKICRRAPKPGSAGRSARAFFETNFRPFRISKLGEAQGFLTGYYEPVIEGSRTADGEYAVPLYRRPSDLVALDAPRKLDPFPNKGRVGRAIGKGRIADYFDRAAIEDGALKGRGLEICYLKDPIEAFFAQIQGSARVRLKQGGVLRITYDAHNGHPYTPVGRILIERKIVPKEEMSMDRIRQWMLSNPDEAREVRRQNRSYVFFRVTGLGKNEEPVGAQGAPLTAGRSIAIDKALHAYGTPFWIEADLPIGPDGASSPFRRLMIAQDTGSAIVGPARADLYFGAGEKAGRLAGGIRHAGRFVVLIPRRLDPARARVPLPRPRPDASQARSR